MSREISLLLAGDALITRPWSHVREADFLGLIDEDSTPTLRSSIRTDPEFKGTPRPTPAGRMRLHLRTFRRAEIGRIAMLAHVSNSAELKLPRRIADPAYLQNCGVLITGARSLTPAKSIDLPLSLTTSSQHP